MDNSSTLIVGQWENNLTEFALETYEDVVKDVETLSGVTGIPVGTRIGMIMEMAALLEQYDSALQDLLSGE